MSDLLKIARAVDGDELFAMRVNIACDLAGKPGGRPALLHVAKTVVDNIECDADLTVRTSGVTDEQITDAVTGMEVES